MRVAVQRVKTADTPAGVAKSEMGGVRAGAIVFVGIAFANLANYGFHLLSARFLGPASYGDVATLAAVTGTIGLPLGGVQFFVARRVARAAALDHRVNDDGFVSGFGGAFLAAGCALTVTLLALAPLIQRALSISSLGSVVFTLLCTAPAFLAPVLFGTAQGSQRFLLLTVAMGAPPVIRIALEAILLEAGLGVEGAMFATFVSALVGVAILLVPLREELGPVAAWRPRVSRQEIASLTPVLGGLLAVTALSTDDLLVAKIVFSGHQAGLYGSGSLIGRVILYLPAAVVTVLLPKVSARVAARRETTGIFVQSVGVTLAFCVAATLAYAAAPHLIVGIAFGSKYQGTASLLWMFGVTMSIYALLNILLTYQLGHGATRTSWLLLLGAVVQAVLFTAFHATPRELLTVSMLVGAGLLVIHELFVAPILLPLARDAGRRRVT